MEYKKNFNPDCPLNWWITANGKHVIHSTRKYFYKNKEYWYCFFNKYYEIDRFVVKSCVFDDDGNLMELYKLTDEYRKSENYNYHLIPPPKFPFLNWRNKYGIVKSGFLFDVNEFKLFPDTWMVNFHIFHSNPILLSFNSKGEPCEPILLSQVDYDSILRPPLYSQRKKLNHSRIPLIL